MNEAPGEGVAVARLAVGREERHMQSLDRECLRRFGAAIGLGGDPAVTQPALAHWAWFLPTPSDSDIGADGHPSRGSFLPALPSLPRRMFASTEIRFLSPLALDRLAQLTTRILDVRHKTGRSGDLVLVDVERRIDQDGAVRIVETQTLVYRSASNGALTPLPAPAEDASTDPEDGAVWIPSTLNLFRFSAVTFNGHRIHYDSAYARDVEGYPALIVQGPFIAAKLAELAARNGPLASFRFRAQAPCFVDQPIRLNRRGDGTLEAVRCDGAVASVATSEYF